MDLSLEKRPNKVTIIRGTGRHWPDAEGSSEANKRRREECFELKSDESDFRQKMDAALHRHESAPITSVIEGTLGTESEENPDPEFVEMTQRWTVTSVNIFFLFI